MQLTVDQAAGKAVNAAAVPTVSQFHVAAVNVIQKHAQAVGGRSRK
jgi:hypothetical protein